MGGTAARYLRRTSEFAAVFSFFRQELRVPRGALISSYEAEDFKKAWRHVGGGGEGLAGVVCVCVCVCVCAE